MSDALPQKRILPPRERRESANKRRDLTPPVKPSPVPTSKKKPTPAKSTPDSTSSKRGEYTRGPYNTKKKSLATVVIRDASTPGVEEVLPTQLVETKPLPTLRSQQPESLSNKEYQSIAESAVLAAALHRSRMRWLCDGIFEKYWTKPVKKKGISEVPANNPDSKTMSKMTGTVMVTIEPHVFDAVFYTVRETPPAPPQPKLANQHVKPAPTSGYYPSPGWGPPPPPPQQPNPYPQQNVPDHTVTPGSRPPTASGKPEPSPTPAGEPPFTDIKDVKVKGGASDMQRVMHTKDIKLRGGAPGPSTPSAAPAADPPKPNTDPVIQMLASRAATDPHLKELMKQVATSKASPAQLKEFQSHIDEFNAVIKRQETEGKRPEPGRPPKSHTPASKPSTPAASHPAMYSSPTLAAGRGTPIYSTPPPHAAYPPYPPPPVSRPIPKAEPSITGIAFELTTAPSYNQSSSQDRWLFPPYAVLDTPHSGRGLEMIVSFFVERTGAQIKKSLGITAEDEAGSHKWKNETTYFQPVTMKLNCAQHKPLMTIAVNAKSLPDVQKYMEGVMKEKTRARDEWLALRLPRLGVDLAGESDLEKFRDSGVEVDEEEDELKDFYDVS
jgi:hypothetical protein